MKKVYDILTSEVVDMSVRKSAADQLGIIMQGNLLIEISPAKDYDTFSI